MKPSEDISFEITFYEGVVDKAPLFAEALILLGDLYTKDGQYEKGLAIDKRLVVLNPNDPIVLYNLACSQSLLGLIDEAFATIRRAVECGYDDFTHLTNDPDLDLLRRYENFRSYIDGILKQTASSQDESSG